MHIVDLLFLFVRLSFFVCASCTCLLFHSLCTGINVLESHNSQCSRLRFSANAAGYSVCVCACSARVLLTLFLFHFDFVSSHSTFECSYASDCFFLLARFCAVPFHLTCAGYGYRCYQWSACAPASVCVCISVRTVCDLLYWGGEFFVVFKFVAVLGSYTSSPATEDKT